MHHQPVRSQRQPPVFLARLGTRRLCEPTGGHSVLSTTDEVKETHRSLEPLRPWLAMHPAICQIILALLLKYQALPLSLTCQIGAKD